MATYWAARRRRKARAIGYFGWTEDGRLVFVSAEGASVGELPSAASIRAEDERLRAILDQLPDGSITINFGSEVTD